jgi:hypothetical protein
VTDVTPTTTSTPAIPQPKVLRKAEQAPTPTTISLKVAAGGTPKAGKFFEDIGYFAISGTVSTKSPGTKLAVYWYDAPKKAWRNSANVKTTTAGAYTVQQKVGHAAAIVFRTTIGGAPGEPGAISSNPVKVVVANSYVKEDKPTAKIDSLKNPVVSGSVFPARAGVSIQIQVLKSDRKYYLTVAAKTDTAGTYRATFSYGKAHLATYSVRSAYAATNRSRWETSSVYQIKRVRVLSVVIQKTTTADVLKTYRTGCPVGPSKLRTISMNFYGFDKLMHRGVLIVRSNLTGRITRGFQAALDAGFPISKMRNPNVYGGNDPTQMAANNTSGFNCRKVVGNPYAQSPHSYGIAIDVNTVQNPYRDARGKWWPKNGKSYIDRTPRRAGMLTAHSHLTTQLRHEGFFWGGRWSPGKDYQHFERR